MPQIPRVSQVPIIEPMYDNGVMNPTWVRFFEKLASMLNTGDLADLLTLLQLANQLPTQSLTGQMLLNMSNTQFDTVALPAMQAETMPLVAVPVIPNETMPTITTFIPQTTTFDMVAMPTSEIIAP